MGVEPLQFRAVLGHFPTGVAVITGVDEAGTPTGMAVGSFTSVSLDPPLVAFFPDKTSTSFPRFRGSGSFCANILGADQEHICRVFAARGGDKFAGLSWRPAGSGSPIIDGVLAWIDCDTESIQEAGDHYIVLGRVRDLSVETGPHPLVFFQGGYGRFLSLSIGAWGPDLAVQMHSADFARPYMQTLAESLGAECVAFAPVGEEVVLVARVGAAVGTVIPPAVGYRIPFRPPLGTAFVAWGSAAERKAWLDRGRPATDADVQLLERTLDAVASAGYSVGQRPSWHDRMGDLIGGELDQSAASITVRMNDVIAELPLDFESPDVEHGKVRSVSVPVFGPTGNVVLVLSAPVGVTGAGGTDIASVTDQLGAAADSITADLRAERVL